MPDFDSVSSALMITFSLLGVSILVVGLAMWWLYRVFGHRDDNKAQDDRP